jgi:hypothetical protein
LKWAHRTVKQKVWEETWRFVTNTWLWSSNRKGWFNASWWKLIDLKRKQCNKNYVCHPPRL